MDFIDSTTKKAANISQSILEKYILSIKLFTNHTYQKWAIAIVLCIILSVILVPEIHFLAPKYEIGMISTKDIKADRDFLVEDRESTKQKNIDAAENIKFVYDYDVNMPSVIEGKLVKIFNTADEFFRDVSKDKHSNNIPANFRETQKIKKIFDNTLGFSLSSEEFSTLINQKNFNEIHNKLSRVIVSVYENRFITNAGFTKGEKEKGITLRNLKTQTEEELKDISPVMHIKDIDATLARKVNTIFSKDDQDLRRNILTICKKLIEPNLTFNKEATEKKKTVAMGEVKPVFFQVQKNEMIVREGEKINSLELAKLEAFHRATGDNKFSSISVALGIFCTALFLSLVLYFWRTRNWLKSAHSSNVVDLLVFGLIVILQIAIVKIGIFMSGALNRAFPFISLESFYFAIPFAMGSMIMAILINRNVALILSVLTSFLIGFLFEEKIIFPLYSFLGSVAAAHQIVNSRHRSAFLKVGIFLSIINIATIICLNLLSGNLLNNLFWRLLAGAVGGILTGVLVAGITPIFESIFGFMTDIKFLELANLNQPIFQRMIIEAPGTYHHSIIVASLVEAASEAIGADSILAKVSAYYHDIGKLKKPQYFIENQPSTENKHDKLSPKMSSLIIISHVKDGCELAAEAKLGRQIINIIRESHGTSVVSYFYNKAKKDKDESIRSLSESDFRYPGPKPQTKEAGLVMLGDVVEASSRSLSNPTPARIRSLVRERIESVYTDGQLDECELTLKNLNVIAETFTRILTGIFHHRIDYSEQVQKDGNGKNGNNENPNRK
ncbi:MAG: 7TM-HD extracellular [Smithella sp. PtaU1.Bin162]|nr:MAG: 7TM-HD extracellular [Smithella sp. PtaU1.Bin162]